MNKELSNFVKPQTGQTKQNYIREYITYKEGIKFNPNQTQVNCIALSHDDELFATGNKDGQIILWDIFNRIKLKQYHGENKQPIQYLTFSKDKQYLVALQQIEICDILLFELNSSTFVPSIKFNGNSGTLNKIVITNDSKYIISGSHIDVLIVWDIQQQKMALSKKLSSNIKSISISPNQQLIVSEGCEEIFLFNSKSVVNMFQLSKWKSINPVWICGTNFTPDSKKFISCDFRRIKIWSITNKVKLIKLILCIFTEDVSIVFNGQVLINNNGRIRFWNIANGEQLNCLDLPSKKQFTSTERKQILTNSDMKYIIVKYDQVYIFERFQ